MDDAVVRVLNLSKRYKLYTNPWHRAAEWISLGHLQRHSDFWALKEVSFHLERGECLGIIGPNGAGKTTLLKILSRALYPSAGSFEVRGQTLSLLELGTGFNLQLTGTQNIFNSARLLGFSDEYVKGRLAAIIEFSELGDFMDRPLQIYSTGMYLRLAFSLFACLEPDVYIIDEALAVGDASFQKKCMDKINEMRQSGVTLLFVSHDLWRVEALCNQAIYLNHGLIQSSGLPDVVIRKYLEDIENQSHHQASLQSGQVSPQLKSGVSENDSAKPVVPQFEMYAESPLKVRRLWIGDEQEKMRNEFQAEESFEVVLEYECSETIEQPIFRVVFALPDERRVSVVGWHPGKDQSLQPGTGLIRWRVDGGVLYPRKYVLHASISTWDGVVYDTHKGLGQLLIQAKDLGPVLRLTDDLSACLQYTVKHEP
jgi:ABC-type polysaccharide/polyol phosphate transport system ATPase subunit